MINPHRSKYHYLYWQMAHKAANESPCTRHKVGAIVVTPTGMISVGWNGMPAGMSNECEFDEVTEYDSIMDVTFTRKKTNPEVIHAERNALDKMARQGIPAEGSILFVTRSPCFECCKALHSLGLKAVIYDELHDCTDGLELLKKSGTNVFNREGCIPLSSLQ